MGPNRSLSMPKFIRDYSKVNWDGMNLFFTNYNFLPCLISQDVEYIWDYLKEAINTAIEIYVPSVRVRSQQQPKWFTSNLRHNLNCVRRLRRSYRSAPTQTKKIKLEAAENNLQYLMSESKSHYETSLIQQFSASNNTRIYQYISSLKKQSTLPGTMSFNSSTANNDTDKAELFNTYFYSVFTPPTDVLSSSGTIYNNQLQPILDTIDIDEQVVFNNLCALDSTKATGIDDLNPKIYKECALTLLLPICHLFTICMKFAKIPAQWKDHRIIPIYKSGDKTLVNNYRPLAYYVFYPKYWKELYTIRLWITSITSLLSTSLVSWLADPLYNNFLPIHTPYLRLND